MRIRILEDTATVGEFLKAGQVCDVQDILARALIERGQAEDLFKPKEPETEIIEEAKPTAKKRRKK